MAIALDIDIPDFVKSLLEQWKVRLGKSNAQLDDVVGTGTALPGPTARRDDGLLDLGYKIIERSGVCEYGQSKRDTNNGEPHRSGGR